MTETILDPATCDSCGQALPSPDDGQWRWARGRRIYPDMATAQERAQALNSQRRISSHEFKAAIDAGGDIRIASRRVDGRP